MRISPAERDRIRVEEWRRLLNKHGEMPAIPAATVVVLRDSEGGVQALMLRRNSRIAFGGMWAFPGGRIEAGDHDRTGEPIVAARNAATREASEETSVDLDPADLVYFSFWIPPPIAPKRFATWFFATRFPRSGADVITDNDEIVHHEWMTPADALRRHDTGELELVPPTWVTLHTLRAFTTTEAALEGLRRRRPRQYETRITDGPNGPVSLWPGDAGYDTSDPTVSGARHRLEMTPDGYRFDESGYVDQELS